MHGSAKFTNTAPRSRLPTILPERRPFVSDDIRATAAVETGEEQRNTPFQICLSIGAVLGMGVGAAVGLVGSWIEFMGGGLPVLAIPLLSIGGLVGGLVAGSILGAVVGAIVHPIMMAGRGSPS